MSSRGHFGIALYFPKRQTNVGSLVRTTNILGGSFVSVIGKRYSPQCSDTLKSHKHLPIFEYDTFADFYEHLPYGSMLVGVEMCAKAKNLKDFSHPERAVYLLGAEDYGLPVDVINKCHTIVKMDGEFSMNVAVAGSIVLYHRTGLTN